MFYINTSKNVFRLLGNGTSSQCASGACFDWFPGACATPEKKKKRVKKAIKYSFL